MEYNVTGEQSDLGPYCLQYKLHNKINSKLHKKEKQNNGSLEKKVKLCELHNSCLISNCVYVWFVKQMCKKLETKLGGS